MDSNNIFSMIDWTPGTRDWLYLSIILNVLLILALAFLAAAFYNVIHQEPAAVEAAMSNVAAMFKNL